MWTYYMNAPWTRNGCVRARVVTVAHDVAGLVVQVLVEDNQLVKRDDVLFCIAPSASPPRDSRRSRPMPWPPIAARCRVRRPATPSPTHASVSRQIQEPKTAAAPEAAAK
jgi:hypothetical protein